LKHLKTGAADNSYTLSRAKYDAVSDVAKMRDRDGHPYGPRALIFALLGNGSIRVCPP
jgi:hypothetical protein